MIQNSWAFRQRVFCKKSAEISNNGKNRSDLICDNILSFWVSKLLRNYCYLIFTAQKCSHLTLAKTIKIDVQTRLWRTELSILRAHARGSFENLDHQTKTLSSKMHKHIFIKCFVGLKKPSSKNFQLSNINLLLTFDVMWIPQGTFGNFCKFWWYLQPFDAPLCRPFLVSAYVLGQAILSVIQYWFRKLNSFCKDESLYQKIS